MSCVCVTSPCHCEDAPPLGGTPAACPADARLCPDGSSVGRSGAACEFAACPAALTEAEVRRLADAQPAGFQESFAYGLKAWAPENWALLPLAIPGAFALLGNKPAFALGILSPLIAAAVYFATRSNR